MGTGARRRGSRGVTIVETAIVVTVVVTILFLIVELAFVFRTGTVASSAARAGARLASATYGDAETSAQQNAVLRSIVESVEVALNDLGDQAAPTRLVIYEAGPDGTPAGGDLAVCNASCVDFTWNARTGHFARTGGAGWGDPDNCGRVLDRVGVSVRVRHTAFTALGWPHIDVEEHTVMRLEPGAFRLCTVE